MKYLIVWCALVFTPLSEGEYIDPKNSTEVDGVVGTINRDCKNKFIAHTEAERDSIVSVLSESDKVQGLKVRIIKIDKQ